jgi:Kelch motif
VNAEFRSWINWSGILHGRLSFHSLTAGGLVLAQASAAHAQPSQLSGQFGPRWVATGSLHTPRYNYTMTELPNGKILVAGGQDGGVILNTAELYDPATQSFSLSTNRMNVPRALHTATSLGDGTVLITGGNTTDFGARPVNCSNPQPPSSPTGGSLVTDCAELYDSDTDTFTPVGSLKVPRQNHTATFIETISIAPRKVLIAGGDDGTKSLNSLEGYDYYTKTFTFLNSTLTQDRTGHTATWLSSNNRVLLAGGDTFGSPQTPVTSPSALATAEVIDSAFDQKWGFVTMNAARRGHTATALQDGKVLIAGGLSAVGRVDLATAEIFDPISSMFTSTPGNMTVARSFHAATLMADDDVLIAGGSSNSQALNTAELFSVAGQIFRLAKPTLTPRLNFLLAMPNRGSPQPASGEILAPGGANLTNSHPFAQSMSERYLPSLARLTGPNACAIHPLLCQIVSGHSPLVLSGIVHHAMVVAALPGASENSIKDRSAPLLYRVQISGLGDAWDVAPFTEDGMPLPAERSPSREGTALTLAFKDAKAFHNALQGGLLVFQMTERADTRRDHPIAMKAELEPKPEFARRPEAR